MLLQLSFVSVRMLLPKSASENSLNDLHVTGTTLQNNVFDILQDLEKIALC